jgi:hypothetical protein
MNPRRTALVAAVFITLDLGVSAPAIADQAAGAPKTSVDISVKDAKIIPNVAVKSNPQRQHSACKSPKGKRINVSYSPGWVSTTVYFNNHCNQKRSFQPMMASRTGKRGPAKCITVNPGTKGRKKVRTPGYIVTDVRFINSCS